MALSLLQEWTGWGSQPEHQDPVLCSVVSWLRGGLCVCRVTIKVETLGGSGRELFGARVLEMALNLWGPYLQARGGGGSPGPGSPATLEQAGAGLVGGGWTDRPRTPLCTQRPLACGSARRRRRFSAKQSWGEELCSLSARRGESDAFRKSSIRQNYLLAPLEAPKGRARKRYRN